MVQVGMEKKGTINVIALGKNDREHFRKCVEYVFHKSKFKLEIIRPKREIPQGSVKIKPIVNQQARVTIAADGRSFSEILRQVKKDIDPEKLGVKIREIRSNKKGEVVMTLEGDQRGAGTLKDEINMKSEGVKVKISMNGNSLIIAGIEETTQEEDLKRAVIRSTGLRSEEFFISNIQNGRADTKTATIVLPKTKNL